MAEPTCVMQPFSYTTSPTPFSNDSHQEINPSMYGLKESISFGRYAYEDLEWEKWSSFNSDNRNKHVAEAEKYSKPGSVAQKKAYFEAHFKRIAALKAAALLTNDFHQAKDSDTGDFVVHQNEGYSTRVKEYEYEVDNCKGKVVNPSPPPPPPPPLDHRSSQKHEVVVTEDEESRDVNNEESSSETNNLMEKPLLKVNGDTVSGTTPHTLPLRPCEMTLLKEESTEVVKKKKTPLSSYISSPSVVFAPSPGKSDLIHTGKENYATPIKDSKSSDISSDSQKKRTPLRTSINREFNRILSPVIKKLGNSSKNSTPKTPAKASMNNNVPQPQSATPNFTKSGSVTSLMSSSATTSPSTGGNRKINSPIARRKQKVEDKSNATTTERASQPSKFKAKAEAELNKFRQSFCFKAMSSPDYYDENGTFKSPQQQNESKLLKSPNEEQQLNRTSQGTSALPPLRPSVKQNGLRSKSTTLVPS